MCAPGVSGGCRAWGLVQVGAGMGLAWGEVVHGREDALYGPPLHRFQHVGDGVQGRLVPTASPEDEAELALPRMLEMECRLGPVLCSRSVTEPWPEARVPVAMPMAVSDHTRMSARELMTPHPRPASWSWSTCSCSHWPWSPGASSPRLPLRGPARQGLMAKHQCQGSRPPDPWVSPQQLQQCQQPECQAGHWHLLCSRRAEPPHLAGTVPQRLG